MVVYENLDNGMVKAYSDSGFYIHGGFPEGNYPQVIDPADALRMYTETNIPINKEQDQYTDEEYAQIGKILMGVEE